MPRGKRKGCGGRRRIWLAPPTFSVSPEPQGGAAPRPAQSHLGRAITEMPLILLTRSVAPIGGPIRSLLWTAPPTQTGLHLVANVSRVDNGPFPDVKRMPPPEGAENLRKQTAHQRHSRAPVLRSGPRPGCHHRPGWRHPALQKRRSALTQLRREAPSNIESAEPLRRGGTSRSHRLASRSGKAPYDGARDTRERVVARKMLKTGRPLLAVHAPDSIEDGTPKVESVSLAIRRWADRGTRNDRACCRSYRRSQTPQHQ